MKLAAYFVCPTECWRDARDRIIAFQKGSGNSLNPMEDGRGDHYWYDPEGGQKGVSSKYRDCCRRSDWRVGRAQLAILGTDPPFCRPDAYYGAVDPVNNPNNPVRVDYFPYDQLGNRFGSNFLAPRGWTNFSRKDTGLNQYLQWYSVVNYDDDIAGWGSPQHANGVMMMDGNITAGYNALNQPMMIWSANNPGGKWLWFGFDPLGRCVKRWYAQGDGSGPDAALYLVYDAWNLVQEGYSPWSPTRFYIHGGSVDEIVQSYNSGTGLLAYHYYDASSHCTLLSDGQGNIKEQYYYDAFGSPYFYNNAGNWLGSSPHGNRFLFTGREWLSDLKVYDFRNRLYQPELGRFLQPDPKEFAAGDYNLYRYCHNDPVNHSDPTGLSVKSDEMVRLRAIKYGESLGSHLHRWMTTGIVTMSKSLFTNLVKASFGAHADMTQTLYKDGNRSDPAKAIPIRTNSTATFEHTKNEERTPYEPGHGGVALFLHVHNYGQGSTMFPNAKDDWNTVRTLNAPMLFTSEPLYARGWGLFVTPNGGKNPNETVVDLNR